MLKKTYRLRYFLTSTLLSILVTSSAFGEFQKGTIVLTNGDSIMCLIEVFEPNILLNDVKIRFILNGQKSKVRSKEISKIFFSDANYERITISSKSLFREGQKKFR